MKTQPLFICPLGHSINEAGIFISSNHINFVYIIKYVFISCVFQECYETQQYVWGAYNDIKTLTQR
jgi:hypothetical protein